MHSTLTLFREETMSLSNLNRFVLWTVNLPYQMPSPKSLHMVSHKCPILAPGWTESLAKFTQIIMFKISMSKTWILDTCPCKQDSAKPISHLSCICHRRKWLHCSISARKSVVRRQCRNRKWPRGSSDWTSWFSPWHWQLDITTFIQLANIGIAAGGNVFKIPRKVHLLRKRP